MPANHRLAMKLCGKARQGQPALVLMHFLGGSLREWDEVVDHLGDDISTLALDLPGFGGSAEIPGFDVSRMANAVLAAIEAAGIRHYILVGHSMSAKVAAVIAQRQQEASTQPEQEASGLAGIVLVAGSPPGPEPIDEARRSELIAALGTLHEDDHDRARGYISKNERRDLPGPVEDRAVDELLRMNRAAWVAWLEHGSREDWQERIGVLHLPALVIAGEKDGPLGPEGQRRATMPHLSGARLLVFPDCSHLVPMEQPQQLAAALRQFVEELHVLSTVADSYQTLLASDRVSAPTRAALEQRIAPPGPQTVLNPAQQKTLRAALARVLPQPPGRYIDLAGAIEARLAAGAGDGWRYAVLPDDLTAYRTMLDQLGRQDFAAAAPEIQDSILQGLAGTQAAGTQQGDEASAEARWFEDLRADAAAAWTAHPQTLARLGFSGPGVGGAATTAQGYVELRADQREPWEPVALADLARARP